MSKNRKSFIYIIVIGEKISFRVYRIMKNIPVLIGNPEIKKGMLFSRLSGEDKKILMKVAVCEFLKRQRHILPGYKKGVDYLLEAV